MAEANVAQDGHAFSNAGEQVEDIQTFWNVDDRTAIVIMLSKSLIEPRGGAGRFLYASFFDGTRFTPPVQLRGTTDQGSAAIRSVRVLFLNARGRKGDAIITFVRNDRDEFTSLTDPLLQHRNKNERLWGTYFDRSSSTKAAVGTVQHGFETRATAIDFDNVVDDVMGDDNDNDPSVRSVALVSDSLHGTHDFLDDRVEIRSGDPTTLVHIVFEKDQSEGTTEREIRWQSVAFDLAQEGNAMPQQASATAGTLVGPNGALDPSDTLDLVRGLGEDGQRTAFVHDNHFFWGMHKFGELGQDQIAMDTVFGADGTVTPVRIGSTPTDEEDSTIIESAELVFGTDHGLDSVYVLAGESGFSSGESGSRSADIDLVAVQIAADGSTQEAIEIDAFTAPLDLTDADDDGFFVNPGGNVLSSSPSMRITGDGSYIAILFGQANHASGDLDDGNDTVGESERVAVPYAQIIQTSRNGRARPLADSVLASPLKAPAVENFDDSDPLAEVGDDVEDILFQIELGESDASGPTYQSNMNRMFFSYVQSTDLPPLDPNDPMSPPRNLAMLFVNSFEVTLGAPGVAPTLAMGEPTIEGARVPLPESTLPGANFAGAAQAVVVDRADARDGYLALFFSPLGLDLDIPDLRVFASDGTSTFLISSAGSLLERVAADNELLVRTVGSKSGTRIHVLWREIIAGTESTTELCTRSFEKRRNVFAPALDEPPVVLDNATENEIESDADDESDEGDVEMLADGTTLGVYFREGGHIFYEETTGDATQFHEELGVRDPQLVDDESPEVVVDMRTFAPPMVDDLRRVMTVFQKNIVFQPSISDQNTRVYIRVHD